MFESNGLWIPIAIGNDIYSPSFFSRRFEELAALEGEALLANTPVGSLNALARLKDSIENSWRPFAVDIKAPKTCKTPRRDPNG
jgi:hypothetical protein